MLDKLNDYYERGYLIKQTHPTLPLTIWNYSQTTQYERMWDEVTLMARGLVTDEMGKIVARPFDKFFNIEEAKHNVGTGEFEVYEKMDGSLGILFHYDGGWIFASRGSFMSDQALKFEDIFMKKYDLKQLNTDFTYMFEIIYPENRIVVDYKGLEDAVLLGKRRTWCGTEWSTDQYAEVGFNCVRKYDGISDFKKLKELVADDREGFIVHFNSTGSKCKVKGEEYIRLHKIMTEVSTTSVWRIVANGGNMEEILVNVPDEFYGKIREYEADLRSNFNFIEASAKAELKAVLNKLGDNYTDKDFALAVVNNPMKGYLFALKKGMDISSAIWRQIKPEYTPL